jgi:hypothetical protein
MRVFRLCPVLCLLLAGPAAPAPPAPLAEALGSAAGPPVTYTLAGTVTGADRKPAAGAWVWLSWAGRFFDRGTVEGKTDARGRYRLVLKAPAVQFLALGGAAPGSAPAWKRLKVAPRNTPISSSPGVS